MEPGLTCLKKTHNKLWERSANIDKTADSYVYYNVSKEKLFSL